MHVDIWAQSTIIPAFASPFSTMQLRRNTLNIKLKTHANFLAYVRQILEYVFKREYPSNWSHGMEYHIHYFQDYDVAQTSPHDDYAYG